MPLVRVDMIKGKSPEYKKTVLDCMNDGTTICLTLIEGGYVGYDALGWYFVQIPGEAFDAVFEACGGN